MNKPNGGFDSLPPAPAGVADPVAYRRTRLGASEIAAALGFDEYVSPHLLVLDKRGLMTGRRPENPAADVGRHMEPFIRDWYQAINPGWIVTPNPPSRVHPTGLLLASPDAAVQTLADTGGLECKWRSPYLRHEWGEPGTDQVPVPVKMQAVMGMACTDWAWWDVAVIFGTGTDRAIYRIPRDEELIDLVVTRALAFVTRYLAPDIADLPPLQGTDAEMTMLRRRFAKVQRQACRPLQPGELELAVAFHTARQRRTHWESVEDMFKARLMAAIGDDKGIGGATFTAHWSEVHRQPTTSWKAVADTLAARHPPEVAAHAIAMHTTTPPVQRRFSFYPKKGLVPYDGTHPEHLPSDVALLLGFSRALDQAVDGGGPALDGPGGASEGVGGGALPAGATPPAEPA